MYLQLCNIVPAYELRPVTGNVHRQWTVIFQLLLTIIILLERLIVHS